MFKSAKVIDTNKIEDVNCMICEQILYEPVRCKNEECGNTFCKRCINEWLTKKATCPLCNKEFLASLLTPKEKKFIRSTMI